MGHLTAFSVRRDKEGKRGEVVVHRVLRVECCVLPRNGQAFLKRESEDNLSMRTTWALGRVSWQRRRQQRETHELAAEMASATVRRWAVDLRGWDGRWCFKV